MRRGARAWLELRRQALDETLPPALVRFLTPRGDASDAPIEGDAFEPPPLPTHPVPLSARRR